MEEILEIKTIQNLDCEIGAPPSKAHTLRALFIAALADGESIIKNPLLAEDQKYAINALKDLGVGIEVFENQVKIEGVGAKLKAPDKELFIGNSGVSARFLVPMATLCDGEVVINGTERMRTGRPMQYLIDAIKPLGIDAKSINGNGCPPILINGEGINGGTTELKGNKSSQYFSAILLCAPYAREDVVIKTIGKLYSKPYIDITLDLMKEFGVEAENDNYQEFRVKAGQSYKAREYNVEGDFSNSAYFFAAAAITGGKVKVTNINPNSTQGDRKFVDFLEMMGCEVNKGEDYIEVIGKPLKGIRVDMQNYPDIVQPLAVVAAFAEGKSEFYNISHLKYKECDRLEAPVVELKKMGIDATATEDSIIVKGGKPHGAEIETYNDHRMAMSFSIAGLVVEGMKIKNPENVNKSFPGFYSALEKMRSKEW